MCSFTFKAASMLPADRLASLNTNVQVSGDPVHVAITFAVQCGVSLKFPGSGTCSGCIPTMGSVQTGYKTYKIKQMQA